MNQRASSKSTPKPQPALRTTIPRKNNQKIIWTIAVGFIILISICVCGALIGGFIFKDRLVDLFKGQQKYGLVLKSRSEDGSISGVYRGTGTSFGNDIAFSVSEDGYAVFQDDGSGNSLIVDGREDPNTTMQWDGVLFDGIGGLSGEEQNTMSSLAESEMLTGIAMIPLDAACLKEEQISPRQVAALLVPLQMHLKYNEPDRWKLMNSLIFTSSCDYSENGQNLAASAPVIYLTPADPIPVVPNYFPFDAEGAVELQAGNTSGEN